MDPLPPDPYQALGLARDASQAAIKTAYRKLALKFHPDKAKDKADDFHRVQQAYELIGEEDGRSKYDAEYRLHQLRNESQPRWSKAQPGVDVRTAAFDFRTSPNPDARFAARGPPRYDTQERRPHTSHSSSATPRAASYQYDAGADYFGAGAQSRDKYDSYESMPTRRASQASRTPKSDEKRAEVKKEKLGSTAKARSETKKQRDKDRGFERRAKAASIVSLESDDDDFVHARRDREADPARFAYVRRKESKRSDDDDHADRWSRASEFARTDSVRDYIAKSKVEGPPLERMTPSPPAFPMPMESRRGSREEPEIRTSGGRPEYVRKNSSSKASKEKPSPEPVRSRPSTARKSSLRRSPSQDTERRMPPSLFTANSSPAGIKLPSPVSDSRRSRTVEEPYGFTEERVPPHLRRSETAPTKQSPRNSRRDDTTPVISSNLRYGETNVHDSGYSTGNSPNDDPQAERQRESKGHRYSPEQDSRPTFMHRESSARYARSPSPMRDRDRDRDRDRKEDRDRPSASTKDRERERGGKAPPVSRSASYAAAQFDSARASDSDRTPPTSRRSSIQREGSIRRERPSLERSDSTRGSSRKIPDLARGNSMPLPLHLRTGSAMPEPKRDNYLFGEMRSTSSPIDLRDEDLEDLRPRRGSPYEDSPRPSRRFMSDLDDGYTPPPLHPYGGRRVSEDAGRSRAADARRYIDENAGRREMRRQETWV